MSRSLTLDIAKGFGIILVVVGHCIKAYTIPGIFIYAFHMPLFFLISGICFNGEKYQEFKPFFYKRLRQLLVPAVTFSAIIVLVSYCLFGNDNLLYNLSWKGFPHAFRCIIHRRNCILASIPTVKDEKSDMFIYSPWRSYRSMDIKQRTVLSIQHILFVYSPCILRFRQFDTTNNLTIVIAKLQRLHSDSFRRIIITYRMPSLC